MRRLSAGQAAEEPAKHSGEIDWARLKELFILSYDETDDRRRADRWNSLRLQELEKLLQERELAIERLRVEKAQLDHVLKNMRDGVVMFTDDGRATVINQKYIEMYRLSPERAKPGCTVRELLRQRAAAGAFAGDIDDYIRNQVVRDRVVDRVFEIPDGRFIRVVNRFVGDGGWISTHEDITERQQQEESFRLMFKNNPLPMLVLDVESLLFLDVNDAALSHYGYTRDEFLRLTALDIRPAEYRNHFLSRVNNLSDYQSGAEWFHRKSDGSVFIANVYSRQLRYQGKTARLVVVTDVTERVRAEEERDRNREFLDRVIDNVTMTILVKDARNLRYVLANKAAECLLGVRRNDIIGKTSRELFNTKTAGFIEANDRKLIEQNANFVVPEHEIRTLSNEIRIVKVNRIAIRNPGGDVQYLLAVIDDVTERKQVEDQLRQAQKMEAVGNLTGGVAHDFNNLLTVIMGNLDLLRDEVAGNAAAEQKIESILQASERGADLTRHMLAFSRRQPLQAKEVDVNALIASTTRLLGHTLGEDIAVDFRPADALPSVLVDSSQLVTALLNIALNARDAMPRGGMLTIATRRVELDADYTARHPEVMAGPYVAVEIGDTGTGIPPEVVERIFEPFFTTKPPGQGTGLGLSMVYGFIKQSGGHIKVQSEVGQGSSFLLFLPLAEQIAHPSITAPMRLCSAKRAGNETILAVEDNPDIRLTVVKQLRELGYQVLEADNGATALQILDSAERIDLLFTDMVLPGGLNGKELAAKARAKRPDLKVLFTSGFPGTSSRHGSALEPGDVLLGKPYHKDDLAKLVEDVLLSAA